MNVKTIQKTFSYRLKPSKTQSSTFRQYAGCARYVYNQALSQIKKAIEAKERPPSYKTLANQLPHLKRASKTEWLKSVHSQVLQQTLKDLDKGMQSYYRRIREKQTPGFPHFKCKGVKDSFRFPQYVTCEDNKVHLPKMKEVAYYNSRPIEGTIKQAVVKRHGDHWYIHLACEVAVQSEHKMVEPHKIVGIDVGLLHFAYVSNGQVIDNPRFQKSDLIRLRQAHKNHSRKKRGSKNRKKSAKKLNRLHEKVANRRKDFLHKLSTDIVENQDVVIVEDLNIKGMVQNPRLARSIADAGWGQFRSYLKYKAEWQGKKYIQIGRFEPTSKKCSSCQSKQEMPLKLRRYECKACGLNLDRDYNAALNIRSAGLAVLNACGELSNGWFNEAGIRGFQAM